MVHAYCEDVVRAVGWFRLRSKIFFECVQLNATQFIPKKLVGH